MFRTNRPAKEETANTHTEPNAPATTITAEPEQETPTAPERQYNPPAADQSASRATSEADTLARNIQNGSLSGFVGAGSKVSGEAHFKALLRVDGQISGQISSAGGTLIVGSGGQVDANVDVAIAKINGTVNGDITATESIELGRTAKVYGNLQTPGLTIEQGAVFEGSCKMS